MKERVSIDQLLILECLYNEDYDILDRYDKNFSLEKALNNYQSLERKELIVPTDDKVYYKISVIGKEFYEDIINSSLGVTNITTGLRVRLDEAFETWWDRYPATDTWVSDDSRKFIGSRSLRSGKKEDNKKEFYKILNEGKFSDKDILACLDYELSIKKVDSISTGDNKLKYMQGSLTWLRQRTFENFMDLVRSGDKINSTTSNYELE